MKSHSSLPIVAGAPIVAAVLALFVATATAGGRSTLSEHIDLAGGTETHEYELNVPDAAAEARLTVRARIKSGEIRMRLLDPGGQQRLSGRGSRGTVELDTGTIERPASGAWRLVVDVERAEGRYRVEWLAE